MAAWALVHAPRTTHGPCGEEAVTTCPCEGSWPASELWDAGVKCDSIHGDRDQRTRSAVLDAFKASTIRTLVATDVAARGLDVKDITHVVNVDFPGTIDDYVHRIGRTGRASATGSSHTFFDARADAKYANELVAILEGAGQEVPGALRALCRGGKGGGKGAAWGSKGGKGASWGGKGGKGGYGRGGGKGAGGKGGRGGGKGAGGKGGYRSW